MRQFHLIPVLFFLFVSCNSRQYEKPCSIQNTLLMDRASVFKIQKSYIERNILDSQDSAFVTDLLHISNLFNDVIIELITVSGGIEENTNHLVNGCEKGKKVVSILEKHNLVTQSKEAIEILKKNHKKKNYITTINKINTVLEQFLYGNDALFRDEKKLMSSSSSILISDLIAIQGFINNIILVDYL